MSRRVDPELKKCHVLLAEDEKFQRLGYLDMLSMNEYTVTIVENGLMAKMELQKETNHFDIVLLDVMMPEIDGIELLAWMKKQERLKQIPVVMMTADEKPDSVAHCLNLGASDFLIKPIRPPQIRALSRLLKPQIVTNIVEEKSTYHKVRLLGIGASGVVNLVTRSTDNAQLAMKSIKLGQISAEELRAAENEVTLMKVLVGPTLIRYYEHFIEDNTLYIIMEYAEGGTLFDLINEKKRSKELFSTEQILQWFAQIVLALLLLHSKKILHRDIKTHNLLLTKDNIIKLGDLGIAKLVPTLSEMEQSLKGTPYYFSPEVCQKQPYGQKSDIWALGCVLYELATFTRPFLSSDLPTLLDQIVNKDYEPLPPETDQNIRKLISMTLTKDPMKRASIRDIAELDFIKRELIQFGRDHNCQDEVKMHLLVAGGKSPNRSNPSFSEIEEEQKSAYSPPLKLSPNLEEIVPNIKKGMTMKTVKMGFFQKIDNVFAGSDLKDWLQANYQVDSAQALKACQNLLDQGMIHSVMPQSGEEFYDNSKVYYRLQVDKPGIAVNMARNWQKEARPAVIVSLDLIQQSNELQRKLNAMDKTWNIQDLLESKQYLGFTRTSCELQKVSLVNLSSKEKTAFFLNILQVMQCHKLMLHRGDNFETKKDGILGQVKGYLKSFFGDKKIDFRYNIRGMEFTIQDIKHGILRGNQRSPEGDFKPWDYSDPRTNYVLEKDPRRLILFQSENEKDFPDQLYPFNPDQIDEILDGLCRNYFRNRVFLGEEFSIDDLPEVFLRYRDDIGKSESQVIAWLSTFV